MNDSRLDLELSLLADGDRELDLAADLDRFLWRPALSSDDDEPYWILDFLDCGGAKDK